MMRWLQLLRRCAAPGWFAVALLAWASMGMAGASPWRVSVAHPWTIACVECPRSFDALTDRSLRLLPGGRPAAAYGGDHLYYAWRTDAGWQLQVVDEAPAVGATASLAMSVAGRPHIAYYDALNRDLKYARQDADGWTRETVHAAGDAGMVGALALDRADRPHIVYYRDDGDDVSPRLAYARRGDAGWELADIIELTSTARYISLALDRADRPHVAYYDEGTHHLRYARLTDAGWEVQTVDGDGDVGSGCSLALDADDHPHISYYDYDTVRGALRYATWDGDPMHPWQISVVDDADDVGGYTSLALDRLGRPVISYHDYTHGALKLARGAAPSAGAAALSWQIEVVEDEGDVGFYTSLALDAEDRPHILHFDLTNRAIRYAAWEGDRWQGAEVDRAGRVGEYASLALDAAGILHVSYYDVEGGHLKHAYRAAATWLSETVDDAPGAGFYTSLALDGSGAGHISYQDGYALALKYAFQTPAGWQIATVDAGGEVGAHTSIAVDAAGRPHISYYDATAQAVKYATRGETGWTVETVERVGPPTSTALALDAAGAAHIAYSAGEAAGALRYAVRGEDGWEIETADAAGDMGGRIGLALDAQAAAYISYYDFAGHRVLLAHREAAGWTTEVVAVGVGESHTALALDRNAAPAVAFYDSAAGDLKFARRPVSSRRGAAAVAAGWDIVTVYDQGDVGAYPSLQFDAAGRPWISFYDATNGDLLIAQGPAEARAVFLPLLLRNAAE